MMGIIGEERLSFDEKKQEGLQPIWAKFKEVERINDVEFIANMSPIPELLKPPRKKRSSSTDLSFPSENRQE